MTKLSRRQNQERLMAMLEAAPAGLQWPAMLNAIARESPQTPRGSLRGAARHLFQGSTTVIKVGRGTY